MHKKIFGNDTASALKTVASLYKPEATIRTITDGYENLIIIVNETEVMRFPRTEEVWQNSRAEQYILETLSGSQLPVPKLIHISENPAYLRLSYLKGVHLTTQKIRSLPPHVLQKIGEEIAEFAYAFHSSLPIEEVCPFLTPPTWSYDDYLKRVLIERQDPNHKIDALAKHYYNAWINKKQAKVIVVHDDLHTGNLLFDDDYRITGVLDFGAVCIGTAEQDLRQTYRFGDPALEAAATTYEKLSKQPFDRETAKVWVITQELGAYCREDSGPAHDRAAENLQFWFPGLFV